MIIEDSLSEIVGRVLLSQIGTPHRTYRIHGPIKWNKQKIQQNIHKINQASMGFPYLVLTDQDTEQDCPPNQIKEWVRGDINPNLIYCLATMEVESWVMAHRKAFAKFLSVPPSKIPNQTDQILDPKEFLINLAKGSRRLRLKEDLVPHSESTNKIGPDYNGQLSRFVQQHWCAETAARHSPSLARALRRLREFEPN